MKRMKRRGAEWGHWGAEWGAVWGAEFWLLSYAPQGTSMDGLRAPVVSAESTSSRAMLWA